MKIKKVKAKVAAKTAKCKAKVKAKCGCAKKTAAVAVALLMAFATAGCHMGEVPTAQRAQTAHTDVRFYVQEGGKASFSFGAEFVSLAQANETSGTETMSNTPHNAPVVDTKPDIDVSVPVNKAGAAQSVGSVLGDAVAGLINGATSKSGTTASTACADGSCSTCADGSCADGSCSDCEYQR